MGKYYHILSQSETEILYSQLEGVYERVMVLEVHTKKLRKRVRNNKIKSQRGTNGMNMGELSSRLELSASSQRDMNLTT